MFDEQEHNKKMDHVISNFYAAFNELLTFNGHDAVKPSEWCAMRPIKCTPMPRAEDVILMVMRRKNT